MTTLAQWVEGARPRTLPAAFAPVLAGTGIAIAEGAFRPAYAGLALVVAVALQIGVNYANDYSDGIRGTDSADRVGPFRLVGSGSTPAGLVRVAAFTCFGVAMLAGLGLVVLTGQWWLLAVGAACVLAAWYYTGGRHPYGYLGLGEVFVFVFFGLVAVGGTTYVQVGTACAILVANNLRDLASDRASGKRTLATRLGDRGTRWCFAGLVALTLAGVVGVAWSTGHWLALLGLIVVVPVIGSLRAMLTGVSGMGLVAVLKNTGIAELACSVGLLVGLAVSA